MAFNDEESNPSHIAWKNLLEKIGGKLDGNEIKTLAGWCEVPDRPLERILLDPNPGSALFKELDKNADLWVGQVEKLRAWMIQLRRQDLQLLIDIFEKSQSENTDNEVSMAIEYLSEKFTNQADWKPLCRVLGELPVLITLVNGCASGA